MSGVALQKESGPPEHAERIRQYAGNSPAGPQPVCNSGLMDTREFALCEDYMQGEEAKSAGADDAGRRIEHLRSALVRIGEL